jgi:hypothetical protein
MFQDATSFNQDLSIWEISSSKTFDGMFNGATSFSQILCWDLSCVDPVTLHDCRPFFLNTDGAKADIVDFKCEAPSELHLWP